MTYKKNSLSCLLMLRGADYHREEKIADILLLKEISLCHQPYPNSPVWNTAIIQLSSRQENSESNEE